MLGDTVRRSAASIAGTPAEFAATFGRRGPRPTAVFARYRAGFVFGRTGWGERRAFRDEAAYSLRFGPGRRSHGHAEHGSVTLYAYGKRLVDDSGTFTLNQNPWRWFALGRTAHNVVTVDGVAYDPSITAPLTMTRSGAARDDLTVVDRGNAGVVHRRRVLFSRRLGYLVVEDRVSASTSRTFRQLWHLDSGTAPIVSGSDGQDDPRGRQCPHRPASGRREAADRRGSLRAGPGLDLRQPQSATTRPGRGGGRPRTIGPLPDARRADSPPERSCLRLERPVDAGRVELRHRRRRRPRARPGDVVELGHQLDPRTVAAGAPD